MSQVDDEVLGFCEENDVQFIKLAFCDAFGRQKNISIMSSELPSALSNGVGFDASAVAGFGDVTDSDLFLFPDKASLCLLPWRPERGRVARLFCDVRRTDGTPCESDPRALLRAAAARAQRMDVRLSFGTESEFYLFKTDENGRPTDVPLDDAGYIDAAPADAGENVRREICLTLRQMGIAVERSHHEEGPGQNEIDFRFSDPMTCADNVVSFKAAVSSVAARSGLYADFSPKPRPLDSGNGFHINISLDGDGASTAALRDSFMAGLLARVCELTAFLNPDDASYKRLGAHKAPRCVLWSRANRSALIRVPGTTNGASRMELRSPDNLASPYLAFALLIHAGLDGIEQGLRAPAAFEGNAFSATAQQLSGCARLPESLPEALGLMAKSDFVRRVVPQALIECYLLRGGQDKQAKESN
ncbi:MAG: glutamine synthetase family protein [Oscillospiraceae bacterium]|nr:glutamine synthetase family protein [Oscillospiraceae bacterium]